MLATIVQTIPIYWTLQHQRAETCKKFARRCGALGITAEELKQFRSKSALQTDQGISTSGTLTLRFPRHRPATGTLSPYACAILPNADQTLLPGNFVRVRVGAADEHESVLLVPDAALGSDQGGRYVLVVDQDNMVEQRKVDRPQVGELRVIESGVKPDDRMVVAGILRAVPGQKVDPRPCAPAGPAGTQ